MKNYRSVLFSVLSLLLLLFFSCSKEVSVSPEEKKPDNFAKVFVGSSPAGFKIYLNDKNTGYITPDTVEWLNEGEYKLTLKKKYISDSSVFIRVLKDSVVNKTLDFYSNNKMYGTLDISSEPGGADIYINDSLITEKTPHKLTKVFPGVYNIRLVKTNHWDYKNEIEVYSKRDSYFRVKLKDSTLWVNYNSKNINIPTDNLTSISIDKKGIKWMGTWGKGILSYDEKEWKLLNSSNSPLPSNFVYDVVADKLNRIWSATENGAALYDNGNWQVFTKYNSPIPDKIVNHIFVDSLNRAWLSTQGGLACYDNGNWSVFTTANSGLPNNQVKAVAVHPNGGVWIATFGGGVAKYGTDSTWRVWNRKSTGFAGSGNIKYGILNDNIFSIAISPGGRLWIGIFPRIYLKGGCATFDYSSWVSLINYPSQAIYSICFDSEEKVWFCNSNKGLSKETGHLTFTTYNTENSRLEHNNIYEMVIDKNGVKWLASYGGGLIKYKGN